MFGATLQDQAVEMLRDLYAGEPVPARTLAACLDVTPQAVNRALLGVRDVARPIHRRGYVPASQSEAESVQ